jgi:hypothetical protein
MSIPILLFIKNDAGNSNGTVSPYIDKILRLRKILNIQKRVPFINYLVIQNLRGHMEMNLLNKRMFYILDTWNYLNFFKNIKFYAVTTAPEEYIRELTRIFGG